MARKPKQEEHENHERWLVSYADFITLLFAFFVVMYSVSAINEGKFRTVSESIQAALRPIASRPANKLRFDVGDYKAALAPPLNPRVRIIRQMDEAFKKFDHKNEGKAQMTVLPTSEGVMITMDDSMMFESGQAELRPSILPMLEMLGEVMLEVGLKEVRVQGHTDNVPIRSLQFPSNWELSSTRAVAVVRALTEFYHVPPEQVIASGFAEFRPIADNLTPEQRAKNRRVEMLVILNDPGVLSE